MTFNYLVTITDSNHLVDDAALLACTNAALAEWSAILNGAGTLRIEVSVSTDPAFGTASGGSTSSVFMGKDGALNEFMPSATYELLTGTHANGQTFDGHINMDPTFFRNGWSNVGQPLPTNSYSIVDIMAHELGHVFGITSFKNTTTGVPTGNAESIWDTNLRISTTGTATFIGARAVSAYGGSVPVTTTPASNGSHAEFYSHLGNSSADGLGSIDVMSGIGLSRGVLHPISAVDRAIMFDILNPVTTIQNAAQISQSNSAGAILEIYQAMTGATPTLNSFASGVQTIVVIESIAGTSGGAANGWVAIGASLADSGFATAFSQKFGTLTDSAFIVSAFTEVFGGVPSTVADATGRSQLSSLTQEFNLFKGYYAGAFDPTDPSGTIRAKGAYLADLLHQGSDIHLGRYAVAEEAFLAHAATHPNDYGGSLFSLLA